MARGRMLSKSLSTSQRFAALYGRAGELAEFCQSLFPLLVAHADDFGRLQGDVFTVMHQAHPSSPRTENEFSAALQALHDVRLVIWYEVGERRYLQIVDFERHQVGLHKRTKSHFPRVPGKSRKFRELPSQLNRRELNLTEQKGTKEKSSGADAPRRTDGPLIIEDNVGVITVVAHEALDQLGPTNPDLPEAIKALCAQRRIAYDSAVVRKALDSAIEQRKRRQAS